MSSTFSKNPVFFINSRVFPLFQISKKSKRGALKHPTPIVYKKYKAIQPSRLTFENRCILYASKRDKRNFLFSVKQYRCVFVRQKDSINLTALLNNTNTVCPESQRQTLNSKVTADSEPLRVNLFGRRNRSKPTGNFHVLYECGVRCLCNKVIVEA